MKLVIFDLDDTLIGVLPLHDKAIAMAFRKVFGVEARFSEVDYAGKTLHHLVPELAALRGINKSIARRNTRRVISLYEKFFAEYLKNGINRFVLPGVSRVLCSLKKRRHLIVVSGGGHKNVVNELKKTKLYKYFDCFISGEFAENKKELAKLALKKAEKLAGHKFSRGDIWFVGDSARDVAAGQSIGARTIGVLTGQHDAKRLKRAKADHIFRNLSDKRLLKVVYG